MTAISSLIQYLRSCAPEFPRCVEAADALESQAQCLEIERADFVRVEKQWCEHVEALQREVAGLEARLGWFAGHDFDLDSVQALQRENSELQARADWAVQKIVGASEAIRGFKRRVSELEGFCDHYKRSLIAVDLKRGAAERRVEELEKAAQPFSVCTRPSFRDAAPRDESIRVIEEACGSCDGCRLAAALSSDKDA